MKSLRIGDSAVAFMLYCVANMALCIPLTGSAAAEEPATRPGGAEPAAGGGSIHVHLITTLGDLVLELYPDKAPGTVKNFLEYVDSGYYDNTAFHRVISNFMAQGGGRTADGNEKPGKRAAIQNEADNGLSNEKHTVAMARTGDPHSATTEFFINFADNRRLDHKDKNPANWGYCVFGKLIAGADTLEAIRTTPVEIDQRIDPRSPVRPVCAIVIQKAVRLSAEKSAEVTKGCKVNEQAAQAAREAAEAARKAAEAARKAAEAGRKAAEAAREATSEAQFKAAMEFLGKRGVDPAKGKKTASGLWVLHVTEGSGTAPVGTDSVEAHYTGWLTNGSQFDSSHDRGQSITFPLRGVIKGWTEGLQLMLPGGKAYLVIPSELAYGKRGSGQKIPPDAMLVFEVELIKVNP